MKVPAGTQGALEASDTRRYFVPRTSRPTGGWVRLDVAPVDWDEARELLVEPYCLCAPKKLAAEVRP